MTQKPSLPKGTRDLGPEQMIKRDYLINTIKKVFKKYGFMPLETPAMENLSVLTGKYGDEGDQLLFRILNSGDFLGKTSEEDYKKGSKNLGSKIADKGLKYDLTVPFARYVTMNRNDLAFPFRRYQIQPVWRADRPQKGRYREFYQCDADIIGTRALIGEAELMVMVHEVFDRLNFTEYTVALNSRRVLEGIAEILGIRDRFSMFCVVLDKQDKIGKDKMFGELRKAGMGEQSLQTLETILSIPGSTTEKLDALSGLFDRTQTDPGCIQEIKDILNYTDRLGLKHHRIEFDPTLARGLSYYTGAIYEVKPTTIRMGSITAGGRYDDLTGVFGMEGVSGVGISFGIDRIYDTLEELGLFPAENPEATRVLITNFSREPEEHALEIVGRLRANGISSEIYPEPVKLKKQLSYADKKGIPFTLMVGPEEVETGLYQLKNMRDGTQRETDLPGLINFFNTTTHDQYT